MEKAEFFINSDDVPTCLIDLFITMKAHQLAASEVIISRICEGNTDEKEEMLNTLNSLAYKKSNETLEDVYARFGTPVPMEYLLKKL